MIPHDFGRGRPTPINSDAQLKAEMNIVKSLGNMQISNAILEETEGSQARQGSGFHPLDAQFASLGLTEATRLDLNPAEFDHLEKYLYHSKEGCNPTSDTTIQHTYRTPRSSEVERFIAGGYDPSGLKTKIVQDQRRLIWHGR